MYKKAISITLMLAAYTSLHAQIGIGTTSPHQSSVLDVESNDKGFLPPRVSSHSDVSNPASGLIVYDETDNCINVYNGTEWVNLCTSGGSGSSGAFPGPLGQSSDPYSDLYGTDLRFRQVIIGNTQRRSGGIDENNNLFMWGYEPNSGDAAGMISEFNGHVPTNNLRNYYSSPYFLSHPQINGNAKKLLFGNYGNAHGLLTYDSLLFLWGREYNELLGPNISFKELTPVLFDASELPAGADPDAKIVDAHFSFNLGRALFIITDEGKLYFRGQNASVSPATQQNTFREIPYPASVTDPSFTYTEIMSGSNSGQESVNVLFVKGSDNEIYAMGVNEYYGFGNSSVPQGYHNITSASNIHKVNFPAGHANITKIAHNRYFSLALAADGQAYGWGYQKSVGGDTTVYFNVDPATPLRTLSVTRIVEEPALLVLPSEITSIIDVSVYPGNYVSGIVGNNNQVYLCGNLSNISSGGVSIMYNDNALKRYSRVMNSSMYNMRALELGDRSISFIDTDNKFYWMGTSYSHNLGGYFQHGNTSHFPTNPSSQSFLYPLLGGNHDSEHDNVQAVN